jgi:hypothetical protein
MKDGIDKYVGTWVSKSGWIVEIKKKTNATASVTLKNPNGEIIIREFMDGLPAASMQSSYDDYMGAFDVELGEAGSGFELNLEYEPEYQLDEKNRDALVPALSRDSNDNNLDQYYRSLGSLEHYTCRKPEVD